MNEEKRILTHVAGTFLIHADGAFLNGAGIDPRREDRNTTLPKTYRDGSGNRVPYVSAQAWRRWLRNTLIEDSGWPASQIRARDLSEKGTTNKIAGELNPVDFVEDDIFGYMWAAKGQGRESASDLEGDATEDESERDAKVRFFNVVTKDVRAVQTGNTGRGKKAKALKVEERLKLAGDVLQKLQQELDKRAQEDEELDGESITRKLTDIRKKLDTAENREAAMKGFQRELSQVVQIFNPGRIKSLMRASPFAASLLVSVRRKGWEGLDKGFVHLQEGTPLPYNTEFYNTHLEGVFCLDYKRLGRFWNLGDRIELDEEKVERFLEENPPKIRVVEDKDTLGKIYEMIDAGTKRKERAAALFKALAVLRGGAKQAQFGTDVAPKVLILAGLTCGNPIFNHLFSDGANGPELKVGALKEVVADYADRIVTPVLIGVRSGYLSAESEKALREAAGRYRVTKERELEVEGPAGEQDEAAKYIEIKVTTPLESARCLGDLLP